MGISIGRGRVWAIGAVLMAGWLLGSIASAQTTPADKDRILFDFEGPADAASWEAAKSSDLSKAEPPARAELVQEHATSGKSSLKITFAGGSLPGVATAKLAIDEWKPPLMTFKADVTASRACVVFFRAIPEKTGVSAEENSLFVKIARLEKGLNRVEDVLYPSGFGGYCSLGPKCGKIVSFEIRLLDAADGESIFVDNIRLSESAPENATPFRQRGFDNLGDRVADYRTAPQLDRKIKVLGSEVEYASVVEMARAMADKWAEPKEATIDEVEAEFKARYEQLKKDHPGAVMTILRNGQKGSDPADPTKAFAGWTGVNAGFASANNLMARSILQKFRTETAYEFCSRRRFPLLRCDLSSIPAGSKILAAQVVLTRVAKPDPAKANGPWRVNSPYKPTFYVFEPCNRPWVEEEANAIQYAKGKYWKEAGGMDWTGDDPDFDPLVIASGQSQATVCRWDFREAVTYWTDGKHANHGFAMYPVTGYLDFGRWAPVRGAMPSRPVLMVIYESSK